MSKINRHGLSDDIPSPIAREVRQRCGFGCVICGKALYQYEHVDPTFEDAKRHDANCIVLLCGGCHDSVTRGFLSKDTVKEKALHPKCLEEGFSFGPFDIGTRPVEILLGTILARNTQTLIRVCGENIFSVSPPPKPGQPFLINAFFSNKNGSPILSIVENEWRPSTDNWDVEAVGGRIIIRNAPRDFALVLRSEPPHRLVVERMAMEHKGIRIECSEGKKLRVIMADGANFTSIACEADGWEIGINANEHGLVIGTGGSTTITEMVLDSSIAHGVVIGVAANRQRLSLCPCGSNLWYKKCHGLILPDVPATLRLGADRGLGVIRPPSHGQSDLS